MTTALFRPCAARTSSEPPRAEAPELLELASRTWTLRAAPGVLLVRPNTVRDLSAVAQMHRRCSPRSLLDRYRQGGRPPTAAALDAELRNRLGVVAATADGQVVATAAVRADRTHHQSSAEATLLVEDAWQHLGVGGALLSHVAGTAYVAGFTELIAYPSTALGVARRLMTEIGRSRMVPGADAHVHTALTEAATLGLGPVRQQLAG